MPDEPAFERRIVSVLFADLVGFTTLSERLDPEDVAAVQDAYFASVREAIARHGGVLEKFIGDAAMAVFGIPRARDDDAERAVRAGLALVGAVEVLGARLGLDAGPDGGLQLRVGINSGEVAATEGGPDQGRVTGDVVNLAARLQTAAQPGTVVVGEVTSLSVAEAIELESLGKLDLKGKAEPVSAWRVIGIRAERSRDEALGALRAPMLGRETELAALERTLAEVRGAAASALHLFVAPPGVGKSRLLAEFASRADAGGARVLRSRVRADVIGPAETVGQLLLSALGEGASREAAPEVLRQALAAAAVAPDRVAVVVAEVMDSVWPATGPAAGTVGAVPDRDARFGAWFEALDALAGDQPSAWLIEDIHWAGGDLRAFLVAAGPAATRGGRLVVATARPSVLDHAPTGAVVTELAPLAPVDATELVQALVGDALPPEVERAVAGRSDGNPLFIEELLRSWISAGTLVAEDGGWRLAVEPEAVPMPATVQAIYAAQLDDLPSPARLVARRASVVGRRFAVRALEPLEVPDPAEGLDRLRQRAFLRGPEADAGGEEVYAYRHALLRDAGYASLSRAERSRLHLALATWLEQTAGADVAAVAEPIASHYESALAALPAVGASADDRARLADAARTWLERAAESALGVAAHEAAIELLARAVALADSVEEAARLRLRRGELMTAAGDMAAGMDEVQAAFETYRAAFLADRNDGAARNGYGHAAAVLGKAMNSQIRFTDARDLAAATLADLGAGNDVVIGRLVALHAWSRVSQGDRDGTIEDVERALKMVQGADPQIEVEVLGWRAMIQAEGGTGGDWDSLEQAARANGWWGEAVGAVLMRAGNDLTSPRAAVLVDIQSARDLALTHGLTEAACRARCAAIETRLQSGEWDTALAEGFENLEITERNAYHRATFRTWIAMAPILAARGDRQSLDRYRRWHVEHRSTFPDPPSPYGQVHLAAMDRLLTAIGLSPAYGREVAAETVGTEAYTNADYVAAVEILIGGWIADGASHLASSALEAVRWRWLDPADEPSKLMRSGLALMDAWLARSAGARTGNHAADPGRRAAGLAREAEAPWWLARAIRALPDGVATGEELAECEAIERRLGVRPGASDPPMEPEPPG